VKALELRTGTARTRRIALISIFAVLSVVLDSVVIPGFSSGIWYGWIFLMSPVNGILLGPRDGFFATLISVMVGHSLVFRESIYEFIFTLGAPLGSLVSGLIFRKKWGIAILLFTFMLAAYFLTPVSWSLPFWGMWDVYVAFIVIIVIGLLNRQGMLNLAGNNRAVFALSAFLGLEADILFRIFILVPCQAYRLFYGLTSEALIFIWAVPAPLITPLKVALATAVAATIGPTLMGMLKESQIFTVKESRDREI
jgi:hypothetical protein